MKTLEELETEKKELLLPIEKEKKTLQQVSGNLCSFEINMFTLVSTASISILCLYEYS